LNIVTGKYVLLVEDNPDEVFLTRQAFLRGQVPHQLAVVSDGRAALDFLFSLPASVGPAAGDRPALILLDLNLPLVNGLEVLREVRSNPQTADIPVIVMTSSAEHCDRTESYRLGANDYICKPTGFQAFVEIIQQIKIHWLSST
jgi:two-component system, response regulator